MTIEDLGAGVGCRFVTGFSDTFNYIRACSKVLEKPYTTLHPTLPEIEGDVWEQQQMMALVD